MKFPLAHIIAVALIIFSSLLVTAHLGQNTMRGKFSSNGEKDTFTVSAPKEMTEDREPVVPKRLVRDEEKQREMQGTIQEEEQDEQNKFHVHSSLPSRNHASVTELNKKEAKRQVSGRAKRSPCSTSCKELLRCNGTLSSGYYSIQTSKGEKNVYCYMESDNGGNNAKGWTRVAFINATYDNSTCRGLTHTAVLTCRYGSECPTMPMCTRSEHSPSVIFPTHGIPYTKVRGRARGYQFGYTRAFHSYKYAGQDLNSAYVSGLSVTHGAPGSRSHIWTFAAGYSQAYGYIAVNCPCAIYPGPDPPPFVGDNYFCDSGNPNNVNRPNYIEHNVTNPLWNSGGCGHRSREDCCQHHDPWFTTDVGNGTEVTDDIEVRWCHFPPYTHIEDIGVDQLEIYVY